MKIFYPALALFALAPMSARAAAPVAAEHSGYTGTSFNANWEEPDQARLTVFSLNSASTKTETQDFSSAIVNGRIDQAAAAALRPEWDIQTSGDGSGNVRFVNGKDMLALDGNGSSVAIVSRKGFLKSLRVKAYLINAEGVTKDNASYLTLDILCNDGTRWGMKGQVSAIAFGMQNEFDFAQNFLSPGEVSKVSGIRIAIEKDDMNNVGDLAIESISYEYDERDYLLKDVAVSGGTHLVENCDPSKAYFYYLSSADDGAQSRIMVADGFLAPELLEPELVSSTSYTARWSTPYKAESMLLRNYKVTEFAEPTDYYILNEDFDKADKGTVELPEYTSDIDQYCNLPGWEIAGAAGRIAVGMIGTAASPRPWPPMGGYMYSPDLDLSACGGVYKLSFKLYGEPGDIISVFREGSMTPNYQLYGHQFTFDDNGVVEAEYEMDDGVEGKSIHFESKGMKQFLIDYFRVSQKMPAGSVAYTLVSEETLTPSETSYTFSDLEENGKYAYGLVLYGRELNTMQRSVANEAFRHVDLSEYASVESVQDAPLAAVSVTSGGGLVTVNSAADCRVALYRFDGRVIGQANVQAGGFASFPVAPGTPVIVKAGNDVVRLIAK